MAEGLATVASLAVLVAAQALERVGRGRRRARAGGVAWGSIPIEVIAVLALGRVLELAEHGRGVLAVGLGRRCLARPRGAGVVAGVLEHRAGRSVAASWPSWSTW